MSRKEPDRGYPIQDYNRTARNRLRNQLAQLRDEVLPALREQADRTLKAVAAAQAEQDAQDATRQRVRADLRARQSRGLA